jgi:hypothetical protein
MHLHDHEHVGRVGEQEAKKSSAASVRRDTASKWYR